MHVTNFSDGFSPLPVTAYYGDPAISSVSNLSLDSIKGNSDLTHANVIGLSDSHDDDVQIEVRARIVAEVLKTRNHSGRVYVLQEGIFFGEVADQSAFENRMGRTLDYSKFRVLGWDDSDLHAMSMDLLKGISGLEFLKSENLKKKFYIIKDGTPPEKYMEDIEYWDQKYEKQINECHEAIYSLARRRDESKANTIRQVRYLDPDAIIFVVAGRAHFENVSKEIGDIAHCVLNIKRFTPYSPDSFKKVYEFLF